MSASSLRLTRRAFVAGLNLSLGGLALGLHRGSALAREPSGDAGPAPRPSSEAVEDRTRGLAPNVLVHVAETGLVTIVCHRSEMGQGVRTAIPTLIGDELGADLSRVVVRQADGHEQYGDQNTDGSTSIRKFEEELRQAGATARTMLVAAAAKRWRVSPEQCEARGGAVHHAVTKRSSSFGQLAAAASKLPVPALATVKLRPRSELSHVNGPGMPLVDGPDIVSGTARFGADVALDGMLIAVIARPPVVGGRIERLDPSGALAVAGVRKVIRLPEPKRPYGFSPWGGVAVVADTTWAALKGRAVLDVSWTGGDNAAYDSTAYRQTLLASVREPGTAYRNLGNVEAAFTKAARVLEAEYVVPHLAHLPMEPPVALARFHEGRCEIWAPTQHPQAARAEAAKVLGIDEKSVIVHVTLLGGGFGRKSKADFVAEVAFLAREVGAPVRVQWTRGDDLKHDYYNTVSAQRIRAGLDSSGKLLAWHHRTAFPPIASTFEEAEQPSERDLQQGVLDVALDAPNVRAEACSAKAHVRVGWYRSVYNIFHAFAVGSMIDEIAAARGLDPREAWLEVIGPPRELGLRALGVRDLVNYGEPLERHPVDAGRLRKVIERVTDIAGWAGREKKDGRAYGLAAHRSFVTYAAVVLAVVPDKRHGVRVDEAWISADAGRIVSQDRVRAQLEGAVIMGISNALWGGVTMKGGVTQQSNFRDARMTRITEAPRAIHVDIAQSDAPPGGVGEPGVPPVAPALANAIFSLTKRRIREIPLSAALTAKQP